MRDFISTGPNPIDEPCVQIGDQGYHQKALAECRRFIALLRHSFGSEPEGAELRIQHFDHDFGTYYEVVCWYDAERPASVDYAFRCESETPDERRDP